MSSAGFSQEREFQTEIVITSLEMIAGKDDVSFDIQVRLILKPWGGCHQMMTMMMMT